MKDKLSPIGCFKNVIFIDYFNFHDRSTRREYWWFTFFNLLFYFIINIAVMIVNNFIRIELLTSISLAYAFLTVIPAIAVGVRRLHDIGRSGWYILLGIIPVIGAIILILFFCIDSENGVNKYGISKKIEW
ncbi:DUF805 domain-containing protein [Salmonella enterica]|nr:DUF805 domain-containing protein [Salmonella enterica]EJF6007467.1 DUF805 domain-containing protein [Salmonella enterica]EJF6161025.1 DUF805 domain-containing protein [Salmonella enterica]